MRCVTLVGKKFTAFFFCRWLHTMFLAKCFSYSSVSTTFLFYYWLREMYDAALFLGNSLFIHEAIDWSFRRSLFLGFHTTLFIVCQGFVYFSYKILASRLTEIYISKLKISFRIYIYVFDESKEKVFEFKYIQLIRKSAADM